MNVALQRLWTPDVFLDWAERQDGRFEFDGTRPIDVTGGSFNHSTIVQNIVIRLREQLRNTSACVFTDVGLTTKGRAIRYPDVFVNFTSTPGQARVVTDAVLVFEVISPSTARNDRIVKVQEYAAVETLRRYVIVETATIGVTVLSRGSSSEPWRVEVLPQPNDTLVLPEIGATFAVAALYELTDVKAAMPDEGEAQPH